jgi:hypothetical protein
VTDYEKAENILGCENMQLLNNAGLTVISQSTLNRLKFENEEMTESLNRFDKLRPTVVEFAHEMEKKLKENDHKVHWSECDIYYLMNRLKQEYEELEEAVLAWVNKKGNKEWVISEAVDCGNFSMFIVDNMKSDFQGKRRF